MAFYAWLQRHRLPAPFFTSEMLCLLIWEVGFIFEIAVTELDAKIILANLQFIGIDYVPVAWLAMTFAYTGQLQRFKSFLIGFSILPLLNQVIIWTNPWHHLFRGNPHIDTTLAPFPILVNDYGLWYYLIQMPMVYLLFLASFVFTIRALRGASGAYRNQLILLIVSTLLPLLFNLLYILGISPVPNFNLSTVVLTFSVLLLGWSLYRYRFLDVLPIARSKLVETLDDPWIVVDVVGRFVDFNPAAQKITGGRLKNLVGQAANIALEQAPELATHLKNSLEGQTEILIGEGLAKRCYELRTFLLHNRRNKITGKLLLLRDITSRKMLEEEREELIRELKEALSQVKVLKGLLPICANCQKIRDEVGKSGTLY